MVCESSGEGESIKSCFATLGDWFCASYIKRFQNITQRQFAAVMSSIGYLLAIMASLAIVYAQSCETQTLSWLIFVIIGRLCSPAGRAQSDCEKARARAGRSTSVINLVPNCEPNGDYSQLQCHSNSTWCQCWKRKSTSLMNFGIELYLMNKICWAADGTPVSQPSRKTKKCDCIMHRHNVRSSGGPANPDGKTER